MFATQTLDRDAQVSSGETQLKSFGAFLDTYDTSLARLRLVLSPSQIDGLSEAAMDSSEADASIEIASTPAVENVSAFQLIDSDNKILNKVLLTFARLCEEAAQLAASSRTYQMRLLYFDEHLCTYEETGQTEECLAGMGDLLGLLYDVQSLAQRCIMVASTILQQLGAVTETGLDLQLTMQFQEIFNCLGDLILQLITFDEILSSSSLQNFWHAYKKSMHSVARNLSRFTNIAYTEFQVNGLVNVLDTVGVLLAGNLFQTFLDSTFKIKEQMSTRALAEIAGHLQDYIRVNLTSIEKLPSCLSEFTETELVIKINAVCILSHNFLGQLEQKSLKTLMDINAKNIGLTLVGNIMWNPDQFFKKHAETLMKNYERQLQERARLRQSFLQAKIQTMPHESRQYCSMVLKWTLQMSTALNGASAASKLQVAHFKNVSNLLLQGLKYAGQLSHLIKSMTKLHVTLHTKMAKPTLLAICKLIECLQIVQTTFQRNFASIAQSIQCVLQYLAYKTLSIVAATKKKLSGQGASRNERHLDLLAALQIAEKCLYGPPTKSRILTASLALNFANPMRVLTPDALQKLHRLLNRLELLANVRANIALLCDPSFMYWNQSILTVYLRQIVAVKSASTTVARSPGAACSMKYLLRTADMCSGQFHVHYATAANAKTLVQFQQANFQQYRQEIGVKQCAQIETFLRLNVHENLAQNKRDPFASSDDGLDECRELVPMAPIVINGQHVVLKDCIENYLSNMFYNLTTISLHDWRTYSEMRHLANYKFNLITIEDHLPTQQLEQGIDVLEIMRNIHVFVSKYLYNMNQQLFIEHSSNNKHLNTIGIRHIANSLRTHGSGIINTTVNFTYQFLRKKLYTFSQFLYDEHIKSRLMKDLKYFRGLTKDVPTSSSSSSQQMYSYERADSLNKGIRKFGLTPDGQSYLDLFRQLISHIGNALGYIRLMRSGGIHASSNVSVYLPRFDDNLQFAGSARAAELSRTTQNAAENLENNIGCLSRCFTDETEYFKLLVEAFVPFFRDPKNIHLRNFYLIIPALTINFVEYILNAKDKIHKKDKNGVRFVDDGLAIGLAYLLRLLDQTGDFQSLHWFMSVKRHYASEREKIQAQRQDIQRVIEAGTAVTDDKLQQTLALTERRINAHQMEFNLLYYDMQSSKIFFQ